MKLFIASLLLLGSSYASAQTLDCEFLNGDWEVTSSEAVVCLKK